VRLLRLLVVFALAGALLAVAGPAAGKAKPKAKPKRHVPAGPTKADKAAAAKLGATAKHFADDAAAAPGEQMPGVQTGWAACSASYTDLSPDQHDELLGTIAGERAMPVIAQEWQTTLAAWDAVKTTNPTLKTLQSFANQEAPEVAKLVSAQPEAICDLAAQWKAADYAEAALVQASDAWVAALGVDETLTVGISHKVFSLHAKLQALGFTNAQFQALGQFFL
jgi:hypothetical protein